MWILYALGASLFWGLTYVFREQVYKHISVFTSLGLTSFFVCIIVLSISYFSGNLKTDIKILTSSKEALLYFFWALGVLLIAELCIGFSITSKSASLAGLIEISYPIFIALFGYLFYKNHISISTVVGGIVIFIGIFIIYYFNS